MTAYCKQQFVPLLFLNIVYYILHIFQTFCTQLLHKFAVLWQSPSVKLKSSGHKCSFACSRSILHPASAGNPGLGCTSNGYMWAARSVAEDLTHGSQVLAITPKKDLKRTFQAYTRTFSLLYIYARRFYATY